MNTRQAVFWIYVLALVIGIGSIATIPQEAWKYIADWQKAVFAFQILLGICGVLIALWVSDDYEEIESHKMELHHISDRVYELEKQQDKKKKQN